MSKACFVLASLVLLELEVELEGLFLDRREWDELVRVGAAVVAFAGCVGDPYFVITSLKLRYLEITYCHDLVAPRVVQRLSDDEQYVPAGPGRGVVFEAGTHRVDAADDDLKVRHCMKKICCREMRENVKCVEGRRCVALERAKF